MLRRIRPSADAIEHRIRDAIEELHPLLPLEEGSVELVRFDPASGVATLRLAGGCRECELTLESLLVGITAHLRMRVPEIRDVHQTTTDDQ